MHLEAAATWSLRAGRVAHDEEIARPRVRLLIEGSVELRVVTSGKREQLLPDGAMNRILRAWSGRMEGSTQSHQLDRSYKRSSPVILLKGFAPGRLVLVNSLRDRSCAAKDSLVQHTTDKDWKRLHSNLYQCPSVQPFAYCIFT